MGAPLAKQILELLLKQDDKREECVGKLKGECVFSWMFEQTVSPWHTKLLRRALGSLRVARKRDGQYSWTSGFLYLVSFFCPGWPLTLESISFLQIRRENEFSILISEKREAAFAQSYIPS